MEKLTPEASSKFNPKTCKGLPSAISLQVSVGGAWLCNWLDGLARSLCGPEAAPASHFPQTDCKKGQVTKGIYGPPSFVSLESAALQSSLENKLKMRLPTDGWMKSAQTWRHRTTLLHRPYCQLVASAHLIKETERGLWLPTIGAQEGKGAGKLRYKGSPHFRGVKMSEGLRTCETDPIYLNPYFAAAVMGYPMSWVLCMDLAMQSFRKSPLSSSPRSSIVEDWV